MIKKGLFLLSITFILCLRALAAIQINATVADISCFGVCDGTVSVTVLGGVSPYSYSWNTGQSSADLTGLCQGTYIVEVTDSVGETATDTFEITEPTQLMVKSDSVKNATCHEASNGKIFITAAGGTKPYTYSWSGPMSFSSTNEDPTGLITGNYNVTVTDLNGCQATLSGIFVGEPADFNYIAQIDNVKCYGGSDGAINFTLSGGTPPYSYLWTKQTFSPVFTIDTVGFTEDVSGLTAGTYKVDVVDGNGCSGGIFYFVSQPDSIDLNGSVIITDVTCPKGKDGAIDLTATGGTGVISYSWSNGELSQDLDNEPAGDYTVTATDLNGCTATATFTIGTPDTFSVTTLTVGDVSCFGFSDGSVDFELTGGTLPYSYQWNGPAGFTSNNEDLIDVEAGTYNVTVTDAHGCKVFESVTINQPDPLDSIVVLSKYNGGYNISCNGESDGAIDLTITGGTMPYAYSWAGPNGFTSTDQDLFNLEAGTYYLTVIDSNGCEFNTSIDLTEPDSLNISAIAHEYNGGNNISCNGSGDGSIDLTVTGGTSPFDFQWTGPNGFTSTDEDLSNLEAGDYFVTVTDANGCLDSLSITLTEPDTLDLLSLTSQFSGGYNISCYGEKDGSIDLTVVGGTAPFQFFWTGPNGFSASSEDISNLQAGSYSVMVTDANNCTDNLAVTLIQPDSLDLVLVAVKYSGGINISCYGESDGSIDLTVGGGTPPYSYSWNGSNGFSALTEDINNLSAGTYTVTVTDANGCLDSTSLTLIQPDSLAVVGLESSYNGGNNISCNGLRDGSVDLTVTGGSQPYGFNWTGPNGFTSTDEDLTNLGAGTYNVTVTDQNGCSDSASFTLIQPDTLEAIVVAGEYEGGNNITCNGSSNGSIDLTVTGGSTPYIYNWMGPNGFSASNEDLGNLSAGTYSVTVTDANGCSDSTAITLVEPDTLEVIATSEDPTGTNISCSGSNDGAIDIAVSGGTQPYSFNWVGPNGFSSTDSNLMGLFAGTYSLTVTDANGCQDSTTITLTEPDVLDAVAVAGEFNGGVNVSCNGENDGSIDLTLTGGTEPYFYAWVGPNGFTSTDEDLMDLVAGDYFVTVTDTNGCQDSTMITLMEPDTLDVLATAVEYVGGSNISCNGFSNGSISLTVTGGTQPYGFSWTGPEGFTSTDENISNLTAGTYSVVVTDDNGCMDSTAITLEEPDSLQLVAVSAEFQGGNNVSCNGESDGGIDLTVTGGTSPYDFVWVGPNGFTSTDEDLTGLEAGDYFVTVTDTNGCVDSASITLMEPDSLQIVSVESEFSGGNNISCNSASDGSIDLTVSGGTGPYDFNWTGPNGFSSTDEDLTGLIAGTYFVIVTDTNGCTDSTSVTLTEPDTLEAVIVDAEYNGGNNISCNGLSDGSIDLTVTGGSQPYSFDWTGPNGFTSTDEDLMNLQAGTYMVLVTDTNGCMDSTSVTLTEPDTLNGIAISPELEGGYNVSCNGFADGSIDLSVTGGTMPYSFSWEGPNGFTSMDEDLVNLDAGTYSVTVSDTNNCMDSTMVTLTQPDSVELVAIAAEYAGGANVSCNNSTDGSIDLTITGGALPYNINWNGPNGFTSNDEDINGLGAGTYSVVVTDTNGCMAQSSVTLEEPDSLDVLTIAATYNGGVNISCNNFTDGSIDLTVSGGTGPFVFDWSGPSGFTSTNEDITGLGAGSYHVVVTDTNGCIDSTSITLVEPDSLEGVAIGLEYTGGNEISCFGLSDGSIDLQVEGGTQPYSFDWSGPNGFTSNDSIIDGLVAGGYYLSITDANGCMDSDSVTMEEPDSLIIETDIISDFSGQPISCHGASDAMVEVTVSGGTAPYSYLWSTGDTTNIVSGLSAGDYFVIVTDTNNCGGDTTEFTITEPDSIVFSMATVTDVSCFEGDDGAIDLQVSGGVLPYNYMWNTGDTAEDLSGLQIGEYCVVVTDTNNCVSDTLCVEVDEPDEIDITSQATGVTCNGYSDGSIVINASGGTPDYQYEWSTPNNDTSTVVSGLSAGDYTVTITDAHECVEEFTINVPDIDPVMISPSIVDVTCDTFIKNGSIELTVSGGTPGYDYFWSTFDTTSSLDDLPAGSYSVTVTDVNECIDSATYEVGGPACVPIPFDDTVTIFEGNDVKIFVLDNDIGPGGTGLVITAIINDPANGTADINSGETITYEPDGGFVGIDTFTYVISCDEDYPVVPCFSANVIINVLPGRPNIFIPDGFSPNGDGTNDIFVIDDIENYPNNELRIFNRWGNRVRKYESYANQWDGTNEEGEPLPDGTYYFVLELNDDTQTTFTGYVIIHR